MKALIYQGPHVLDLADAADPVPQADEVLVAVEAVGICGSDMHAWQGHDERRPAPLILGHEAAGRIAAGPRKGERVTINPLVSFGRPSVRGIATSVLWSRYAAGDDIQHLSHDYALSTDEFDEAIRCETVGQAA